MNMTVLTLIRLVPAFAGLVSLCSTAPVGFAAPQELLCDGNLELSTPNGTFPSSGCWWPDWVGGQAGVLCTTTGGRSGNGIWEFTGTAASDWWAGPYQQFPATPGMVYRSSAWIRTPPGEPWVSGSKAVVRVSLVRPGIIDVYESSGVSTASSGWTFCQVESPPAPADVLYVRFVCYLQKPQVSGLSVANWDDASLLAVVPPPNIVSQPANQTVPMGGAATFSVVASGPGPLSYQWQLNSTNLAVATNSSLAISNTTAIHAGPYRAVVGNEGGSVTSVIATLTVQPASVPVLLSVSPSPNQNAAPSDDSVTLTFNEPINAASVSFQSLAVHTIQSGRWLSTSAVLSVTGGVVSARGHAGFKPGELVQVTATTNLQTLAGGRLANSYVWQFMAKVEGGTGLFADSGQELVGHWNQAVAIGDIDGDGDNDLVVAQVLDTAASPIHLFLNDSRGHFAQRTQVLDSFLAHGLALGDLNGDGTLDLCIAATTGGEVWLNDGLGNFTKTGQILDASEFFNSVGLVDLDGDGDLDMVLAASGSMFANPSVVYRNNGDGTFALAQSFMVPWAHAVKLGDLNGDGLPDAAFLRDDGTSTRSVEIWLNEGAGRLVDSGQPLMPGDGAGFTIADFNGDGSVDIVAGDRVCFNNGRAVFSVSAVPLPAKPGYLYPADVDSDGDLDLVARLFESEGIVDERMAVFLNDAHGTFHVAQPRFSEESIPLFCSLADLDGDGDLDLFLGCAFTNLIWLNQNSRPEIILDYIPPVGSFANVRGHITNLPTPAAFAISTWIGIDGLGLYPKPTCASALIPLNPDGSFELDITTGGVDDQANVVLLYLVPNTFTVPCVLPAACPPPELESQALAKAVVVKHDPGQKRLLFSGQWWRVKRSAVPAGPGGNFFSDAPDNAWVDNLGRLHLRLTQRNGRWNCVEVIGEQTLGYGTYIFELASPVDFAPSVVLGLFTWKDYDCSFGFRELDIEFSKWGNAADPNIGQFVVQPYNQPNHLLRWPMAAEVTPTTHTFTWETNGVAFRSQAGRFTQGPRPQEIISQWTFTNTSEVPLTGGETPRVNLWLQNANPPSDGHEVEIIVNKFDFIPSGVPQLEIKQSTNSITVSWLATFTDFVLEQTDHLGGLWAPVNITPIRAGDVFTTTVTNTSAARLFRLRK